MDDCIKRLKQCVRWFQQLEGNYAVEQEKLKNLLDIAEKKCSDVGKDKFFVYWIPLILLDLFLLVESNSM